MFYTTAAEIKLSDMYSNILVKANINLIVEYTTCNLSRKFLVHLSITVFDFFYHLYSHLSFTAAYSLKSEEDWFGDFVTL